MAPKQSPVITRYLAVSLALLITLQAGACGWGDDYETLRLAFFKADTPGMQKYKPTYYTEHYLNSDTIQSDTDRRRNCTEWQLKLGNGVLINDVYTIQYETAPEEFKKQYDAGQLSTYFKGNTFIEALLRPHNKAVLDYLVFAKQMEYEGGTSATTWESWDDTAPENYWDRTETDTIPEDYSRFIPVQKCLADNKDRFLQERYAFMLIRYGNRDSVVPLYNRYFENSKTTTVVKPWAMLFRAYATANKAEQNYYLSRCFDLCEEKVIAVLQWYNYDLQKQTLALAKNDHERAVIIAINAMRNPGPVFGQIKEVNTLAPGSNYVNLLIAREVNKFEDWLFYIQMHGNSPDVYAYSWNDNNEQEGYMVARIKNYRKDMAYLRSFRQYLIGEYSNAPVGSSHDFLAAAIAHLSFMDDDIANGYKYASAISNDASHSIQVQKYTELALVAAKQGNLASPAVKQQLYNAFSKVDRVIATDGSYSKSLYTLLKLLAAEYNKIGDMATANLLFLKADNYKYEDYDNSSLPDEKFSYTYLGYLDQYAKYNDIDHLVALIDRKDKTPFEKFICEGTTTIRESYLDFKGKLAFRQNNLKLAYESFKQIPDSIAKQLVSTMYADSVDAFFPSILDYGRPKVKGQRLFSTTSFVKEMMALETKTDADSYLKLGHAYYNTSYRGNAWFMDAYYQGHVGWEVSFDDLQKKKEHYSSGNYANLTLAGNYYLKAFKAAKNDEQRAMAALMLHVCARHMDYTKRYSWDEKIKYTATPWLKAFYGKYNRTANFKQYSCPMLEMYLK